MATGTTTDVSYISKVIYPDGFDSKALVREKHALANTPHKKTFTSGKGMEIPVPYTTPQGASAVAATAAANASPAQGASFTVPQVPYYAMLRLNGQVVTNAMKGNADSYFIDQLKYEMDMVQETMGVELNRQLFGAGSGHRGVVGSISIGADTTVTLATISDAVYFEANMVIVIATTATGAIRSAGTTNKATVSKVNTKTGVLTFTGQNFTTLFGTSIAGDYLFRDGDAQSGGSAKVAFGLNDWNPATDPSATTFCGVDRTANPSRQAGVRYDGSSDPLQTVFIRALAQARCEVGPGFKKGVFYLHPLYGAAFRASVEARRVLDKEKVTSYGIAIEMFEIDGIKFIEDPFCPYGKSKMVADGAFVRASAGDQPNWSSIGGEDLWLDRDTDTVKGMVVHYGNFAAMHVNQLLHVDLPTI